MYRLLVIALVTWWITAAGWAAEPIATPALTSATTAIATALNGTDVAAMRHAAETFSTAWAGAEDRIRVADKTAYVAIEETLGDLTYNLQQDSLDLAAAKTASAHLSALVGGSAPATPVVTTTASDQPAVTTVPALLALIETTRVHLAGPDAGAAREAVAAVHAGWLAIEGEVKTRDAGAYSAIEESLLRSKAEFKAGQSAAASVSLSQVATRLAPFRAASSYGMGDAMIILLREGIEALLVIAALLAFLTRAGHGSQRRVIWIGAGAGVAASIILAIVINLVFKATFSDANREVVEGVVGLLAAGLLFWVSWWLHRAANLSRWNSYIADRTQAALATGSSVTLGLLAFLAVVREGAETALFYLGMAPSIATSDLLGGLAIGSVALLVIGVVIITVGVRLPLRPFFAVLGILILAMGVKFIGAGIHALQIAQWVPVTPIGVLPTIDLLGFFPTWETTLGQFTVLALIGLCFWIGSRPTRVTDARLSPPAI